LFEEGLEKTINWYLVNQDWLACINSGDYTTYPKKYYKVLEKS